MDSATPTNRPEACAINRGEITPSNDGTRGASGSHQLLEECGSLTLLYKGPGRKFSCGCRETLDTMPNLQRHLIVCTSYPAGGERVVTQYKCAKCMVILPTMPKMAGHFKGCSGSEVTPSSPLNPSAHMSATDSAATSRSSPTDMVANQCYKCRHCDRAFSSNTGRGVHERAVHGALLHCTAPKDKVPQWSQTEHDLLIEAEAMVRITASLKDERVIRNFPLNLEIAKYIRTKLPSFNRTINSISQRRSHGDVIAYFNSVLARKRSILARRVSRVSLNQRGGSMTQQQLSQPNDCTDDASGSMGSGSSTSDSGEHTSQPVDQSTAGDAPAGCSCPTELEIAVESYLEGLREDLSKAEIIGLLVGLKENLETYNATSFSRIMKRINPLERSFGEKTLTANRCSAGSQPSNRGNKGRAKVAERAQVRKILETQGHKRCLQHLRNPTDAALCSIRTVELFKEVFENTSEEPDTCPYDRQEPVEDSHSIHKPICKGEVLAQLQQLQKGTAPGPDGIRTKDLLEMDPSDLACLFNIFLLHKDVPQALKRNKTTMIPKSAQPDIGDWRPITIASIIDRLFAKILEARLSRAVRLDPSQRGFMKSVDGCGENITAYGGALRYARSRGKTLAIVSIDLAKAFDSVKYSTIERALARKGLDEGTIEMLMNLCNGQKTSIRYDEGSMDVELRKGVRQGWPLSPILFLLVIDELLAELNKADGFQVTSASLEKDTITGLAFADDIILYSSSEHGMKRHLDTTVAWCNARGMRINPKKSSAIYLKSVPKQKKVLITPSPFSVLGEAIPDKGDAFERVLGVHMHHTGKVDHKLDDFTRDLELVRKSSLRPMQKISMLVNCLIPMVKFRLVYGFANIGACNQVDKIIRKFTRDCLHLPKYASRLAMYAAKTEGGLGIPCLPEAVLLAQAKLIGRMQRSSNTITRALADARIHAKVLSRFRAQMGSPELNDQTLATLSRQLRKDRLSKLTSSAQGSGWALFKNAPRMFLDDARARKWTERDAIEALKLRLDVLPTRDAIARTIARGQNIDIKCRGCHGSSEKLGHIISECTSTQVDRVARHDHICAYIERRLLKQLGQNKRGESDNGGTSIHRELTCELLPEEVPGLTHKKIQRPDLVVILPDRVVIIEVSVVYEYDGGRLENSLQRIRRAKHAKYEPLRKVLAARFARRCAVRSLIVGCRGGWLASNNKLFADMGTSFTELDKNACVERAVRGSLIVFKRFAGRTREPLIRHRPSPATGAS